MTRTILTAAALLAAALSVPPAFASDANRMIMPAQESPAENVAEAPPRTAGDMPKTFNAKMVGSEEQDIGTVTLTEMPTGLLVSIDLKNLPEGWRALHIHGTGDCSDHAHHFKKAGGHAATEGQEHGFMSDKGPHAGDLPNIHVNKDGTVKADFYTNLITATELTDKDGAAMMIHADADDYKSALAGNAGTRLACGVVE